MSSSRHGGWAALLIAVLVASACGGGGDGGPRGVESKCPVGALDAAASRVDVVVWHSQTARPLQVMQELVAEYNRSHSKVRVRLESQGASYEELQRKFNASVASRQLPAIIMVDDTFTRSMADSGVVRPAQSCFEASGESLDQLVDTARSYYTIDGALWPASAGIGNALLYYNRNHFRRAGIDPNTVPRSLDEVRDYAERLKRAGVTSTPLVHEFAPWKMEFWLTGAGASVVDNQNGRGDQQTKRATLVRNRPALDLLQWFAGMKADGLLRAIPGTPGQIDQYLALANQSSSMLIDTSSAATSIEAFLGGSLDVDDIGAGDAAPIDVSALDIGAGPFPTLDGSDKTQMGGAAWYLLNTASAAVQAGAWDFMRFMNTPGSQARMLVGGSYIPWVKAANQEPAAVDYYAGKAGLAGRWLELTNRLVLAIDRDFPGPLIGPYDEVRTALRTAQDAVMFDGVAPNDALAKAQADIDRSLERYNAEVE
jgi:sn-glycerol 3-phosphate transport system substrate-binding protein